MASFHYWKKTPTLLFTLKKGPNQNGCSSCSSREGPGLMTQGYPKISAHVCVHGKLWFLSLSQCSWMWGVFLLVILSVSQGRGEASSIYSSDSLSNAIFHNSFINGAGQILSWHKQAEKEKLCQFTLVEKASEIITRGRQHFRNTQQHFAEPPWHTSASTSITVDGI